MRRVAAKVCVGDKEDFFRRLTNIVDDEVRIAAGAYCTARASSQGLESP